MMTFAEKLKQARENKGISQAELARRIGVSRAAISRYESGERTQISTPIVLNMAKCLEVNPLYLGGIPGEEEQQSCENLLEYMFNSPAVQFCFQNADAIRLTTILNAYSVLNHNGRYEALKAISNLTYVPEYTDGALDADMTDDQEFFDHKCISELVDAVEKIARKRRNEHGQR